MVKIPKGGINSIYNFPLQIPIIPGMHAIFLETVNSGRIHGNGTLYNCHA